IASVAEIATFVVMVQEVPCAGMVQVRPVAVQTPPANLPTVPVQVRFPMSPALTLSVSFFRVVATPGVTRFCPWPVLKLSVVLTGPYRFWVSEPLSAWGIPADPEYVLEKISQFVPV